MKELALKSLLSTLLLLLAAVVGILALVSLPLWPFIWLANRWHQAKSDENYRQWLASIEGSCFFFYNSRRNSVTFARGTLVPALDSAVRVVFVDGKTIKAGPDSRYLSRLLLSARQYQGFPHLIKVVDGQVLEQSINNQFYSVVQQSESLAPLLQRIRAFYASPSAFLQT